MFSCRKCILQFPSKSKLENHVRREHQEKFTYKGIVFVRMNRKFTCPFLDVNGEKCQIQSAFPGNIYRHIKNMHKMLEINDHSDDDTFESNFSSDYTYDSCSIKIEVDKRSDPEVEVDNALPIETERQHSHGNQRDVTFTHELDQIGFKFNNRFGLFICENNNKSNSLPCGYSVKENSILNHLVLAHGKRHNRELKIQVENSIRIKNHFDVFEELDIKSSPITPIQGIRIIQDAYWCTYIDIDGIQCSFATQSFNSYKAHITIHPESKYINLRRGPVQSIFSNRTYYKVNEQITQMPAPVTDTSHSIKVKYDQLEFTLNDQEENGILFNLYFTKISRGLCLHLNILFDGMKH